MTIVVSNTAEDQLRSLAIELPNVPRPIANFVPWQRHGDVIYLAGQVCEWNGSVVYKGKVGDAVDFDTARDGARICGLNLLAALREALNGDLDRVRSCLRVGGFVHCAPDFLQVPQVINGASDLFHAVFGPEIGAHARTAVGVAQLPQGASVEVDAIFVVD
ncbi:RidA family protein [Devosia marina]|uniref:RidA family protein n=1 Tax=Devosia marina TaxID=2683198 RepID=A0A7X3K3H3_9HYPH|nr:RidA family protein [Devosia marina]MVS98960.1 RidA family protein [Devosia marina]